MAFLMVLVFKIMFTVSSFENSPTLLMVSYSLMVSIYKGKIKNNSKGLNNKYFLIALKCHFMK
jgi:hypothetical protein